MAKIAADSASQVKTMDGFEGRYEDLGGYTVGFETYTADDDPSPLFAGLPDDACQCPHWGVVLEGTLVYRYTDGTEDVIEAGEGYYAPPGHLPLFKAGTRLVEFSPASELDKTMAVVMANLEAMQAS
ncbi:MAG: cupin domain-containing protein [Acidimicrobiales bacterium]